jgi:hypothetical protein
LFGRVKNSPVRRQHYDGFSNFTFQFKLITMETVSLIIDRHIEGENFSTPRKLVQTVEEDPYAVVTPLSIAVSLSQEDEEEEEEDEWVPSAPREESFMVMNDIRTRQRQLVDLTQQSFQDFNTQIECLQELCKPVLEQIEASKENMQSPSRVLHDRKEAKPGEVQGTSNKKERVEDLNTLQERIATMLTYHRESAHTLDVVHEKRKQMQHELAGLKKEEVHHVVVPPTDRVAHLLGVIRNQGAEALQLEERCKSLNDRVEGLSVRYKVTRELQQSKLDESNQACRLLEDELVSAKYKVLLLVSEADRYQQATLVCWSWCVWNMMHSFLPLGPSKVMCWFVGLAGLVWCGKFLWVSRQGQQVLRVGRGRKNPR